jgi:hypothetical protein
VQLGGIIYVTLLLIVALVLINMLPAINLLGQVVFDGCVAASTGISAAVALAPIADGLNLVEDGGTLAALAEKEGAADSPSAGAADAVSKCASIADASRSLNIGGSAGGAKGIDEEYLTPQQMRSLLRKRRGQSGTCLSSTAGTVASFGRRAMRLGAPPEQDGLLERQRGHDTAPV